MPDTPKTDSVTKSIGDAVRDGTYGQVVPAYFCREIERELPVWRPIETAPKDGRFIDVWAVSKATGSHGARITSVQWCEDHGDWCYFSDHEDAWGIGSPPEWVNMSPRTATHWMPLPQPPAKPSA